MDTNVFPQNGDNNDAAFFAQLLGQSNLTDYVESGLEVTPDYANTDAVVAAGVSFIGIDTADSASTGKTIENVGYAVQTGQTTVSLPYTENVVVVDANVGATDSPTIDVYAPSDTIPGSALQIAVVDVNAETVTSKNRSPTATVSTLTVTEDITANDVSVSNTPSVDTDVVRKLELDSLDGEISTVGKSGSHADLTSVSSDQHHSEDHDHTSASVSAVPNSGLTNSSITVAGNAISLGGSSSISHDDLNSVSPDQHHVAFEPSDYNPVIDTDGEYAYLEDGIQAPIFTSKSDVPTSIGKGEIVFIDGDGLYVEDGT